jgi:hypothetical protein
MPMEDARSTQALLRLNRLGSLASFWALCPDVGPSALYRCRIRIRNCFCILICACGRRRKNTGATHDVFVLRNE